MTCLEKLQKNYPDQWTEMYDANCPDTYGFLPTPEYCDDCCFSRCDDCWNREIPEFKRADILPPEKPATKVVVVSGKAQHGKDTTAGFLKEALEEHGKKVLIAHYGDLVKYVCKTFFDWDGNKDEAGRTILQHVGTDIIRAKTPNYWVDFVLSVLDHFPDTWDYVLIPDCRFPNEIDAVKNAGWNTIHVRVVRGGDFLSPLTEEQQNHTSETALDHVRPDILVLNCHTLDLLKQYAYKVAEYLEEM